MAQAVDFPVQVLGDAPLMLALSIFGLKVIVDVVDISVSNKGKFDVFFKDIGLYDKFSLVLLIILLALPVVFLIPMFVYFSAVVNLMVILSYAFGFESGASMMSSLLIMLVVPSAYFAFLEWRLRP